MNVRIQFEFPEDKLEELEQLMLETDLRTRKDLFNNALTLFQWAVEERRRGRIIASIDEDDLRYKELVLPALSAVRQTPKNARKQKKELALAENGLT